MWCLPGFFVDCIHDASFMNYALSFLITLTIAIQLWPQSVWASKNIVNPDTDKNGEIDDIAHFDKRRKIIKLNIDSNADAIMDRFQYCKAEVIKRIERDTNHDHLSIMRIKGLDDFSARRCERIVTIIH